MIATNTRIEHAAPVERRPLGIRPPAWRRWLKRYPHIRQHDETDCGAACLAMITAYYGNPVGMGRLRDMANVDANGATMWSVAQAAEAVGFHARGLALDLEALRQIHLPAIAHWKGSHYVVLYEVGAKNVVIADPGVGRKCMGKGEFSAGWTGRALELTPTPQLTRMDKHTRSWRRFLPIVRPYRTMILEVLAASLFLAFLGLGTPIFMQMVIDRVLVNRSVELLNMLLVGMVMLVIFQSLMRTVRKLLLVHVSSRVDARLVSDFFRHVFELPLRFFDLRRVGDIVSRVSENQKIRRAMAGTIPAVALDTVLAIGYVVLLASYNLKLTLVVLAILPLFALLIGVFTPILRRTEREQFEKRTEASTYLIESITGISTLKAMAVEPQVRWKLESLFVDSLLMTRRGEHLTTAYSGLATLIQTTSTVVFLWYGAHQVIHNAMTAGQLMAFVAIAGNVLTPVLGLVVAWDELQETRNAVDRLNDVFEAEREQDMECALLTLGQLKGHIRLEEVTFAYTDDGERPALADVSLEVLPEQTVAVVGPSGSGKSTLMKLILGLYPPTKGRITYDGHDLRSVSHASLRRHIGVVPQEAFLFSGTIRENITVSAADVPFDRVVEAAKLAGAHDFICAMGMGYDTKVGERGMSLSGGQRQRIALARALLHSPDILILDEATSALDSISEREVQGNLERVSESRTTIIIAHRLSTVRSADRIVVMDGGRIVADGTHDELMRQGGLYTTLVGQELNQ